MAKRFTDTTKFSDPWYRRLSPMHKLAWDYICHTCDAAGVIDLDRELAAFQIGCEVDWDGFIEAAGDRIELLDNGKLWVTGFIDFQYGRLSRECAAHKPAFASLTKNNLPLPQNKGFQNPSGTFKGRRGEENTNKGVQGETPELETVASDPPDDQPATWGQVEDQLREHGVSRYADAVTGAQRNGCSPEHALACIAVYLERPFAWSAGALYERVRTLHPTHKPGEHWPPESDTYRSRQRDEEREAKARREAAKRQEKKSALEAQRQQEAQREATWGPVVDNLKREEAEKILREANELMAPKLIRGWARGSPPKGMARLELIAYLEEHSAAAST